MVVVLVVVTGAVGGRVLLVVVVAAAVGGVLLFGHWDIADGWLVEFGECCAILQQCCHVYTVGVDVVVAQPPPLAKCQPTGCVAPC